MKLTQFDSKKLEIYYASVLGLVDTWIQSEIQIKQKLDKIASFNVASEKEMIVIESDSSFDSFDHIGESEEDSLDVDDHSPQKVPLLLKSAALTDSVISSIPKSTSKASFLDTSALKSIKGSSFDCESNESDFIKEFDENSQSTLEESTIQISKLETSFKESHG